jgi:hypothetical protein
MPCIVLAAHSWNLLPKRVLRSLQASPQSDECKVVANTSIQAILGFVSSRQVVEACNLTSSFDDTGAQGLTS